MPSSHQTGFKSTFVIGKNSEELIQFNYKFHLKSPIGIRHTHTFDNHQRHDRWNATQPNQNKSVAQSVAYLTQKPEISGLIPGPVKYFPFPPILVQSYWQKNVQIVLVNRLGGLNCPADSPDMTIAVYRGRKPTTQTHPPTIIKTTTLI